MIIGTTFEYGPTMASLADEFPKISWLHISGYQSNGTNYGNLFGGMEDMKYIGGMIAGARAMADNNTKLGYVAPWPNPEVVRLGDAFMQGVKVTCPTCTLQVEWINTWYDPDKEKQAAQSLLDAGVDVILIGSDTPGPLVAAANAGKWALTYDYINSCSPAPKNCLGTEYWNWGVPELAIVKQIRAGTWKPGNVWLEPDSGIVGFTASCRDRLLSRVFPPRSSRWLRLNLPTCWLVSSLTKIYSRVPSRIIRARSRFRRAKHSPLKICLASTRLRSAP